MSAVAPNRAVAATLLLGLMVTSSWCVASAVPAANGRRLQQLAPTGLASRLQALNDGVTALRTQVQLELQAISPSLESVFKSQLFQVSDSLTAANNALDTFVQNLQLTPELLGTSSVQTALEGLVSHLGTVLQTDLPLLQSPAPVGVCFRDLQNRLEGDISNMVSQLQGAALAFPVPAGSPLQPQALIDALQNFGSAVGQVDPCAPGLQILLQQGNDQGVIDAIKALAAGIQA